MNATTMNNNNNNNSERESDCSESKDEVDFVKESTQNNNNYNNILTEHKTNDYSKQNNTNNNNKTNNSKTTIQNSVPNKETNSKKKKNEEKKTLPKERLSLFSFNKKISQKQNNTTKTTVATSDTSTIETTTSTIPATTTATSTALDDTKSEASHKQDSGFAGKLAVIPAIATLPTAVPKQHKFVKSSSLSRLLGNTHNAKKFEKEEQKRLANDGKFNTYAGRRRRLSGPTLERFRQCSKDDGDVVNAEATLDLRDLYGGSRNDLLSLEHPEEEDRSNVDFGTKAMRTISRGLGKLWWRRSHSVAISTPDPEFKVSYLGNVLTGWAKGEGCVEKQLNTLWRNYTQNTKPDVVMRIKVCASGLKATTRQHGLTEYWANRITHCCAPKNYPRVFCWIYRHEGRKLKHELRCHAVLCSKEKIVQDICSTLKENLECALREFKRDKILKQNARLSLANAAYDNPSLPRRKILLSVGGNNYRPPLERSKSAPKLMAIEEAIGEEEGEEIEETNEPEMRACCQKDSLYPAMTLGRRRCRRGHSIRRTGKARVPLCEHFANGGLLETLEQSKAAVSCCSSSSAHTKEQHEERVAVTEEQRHSYGSDDSDDFEKLLKGNNYDPGNSLANELMPYFDMQLNKQTSCSLGSLSELKHNDDEACDEGEPLSLLPTINSDPSADPTAEYCLDGQHAPECQELVVGLRRSGVCSDGEEDYLDANDMYFRQASIFNMIHRNSMRKMAHLSLSSDESSLDTNSSMQYHHQIQSSISSNASSTATSVSAAETNAQRDSDTQQKCQPMDSDEGSISSGCETASTVTANQDDTSLRYRQSKLLPPLKQLSSVELELHPEEDSPPISVEEIYQRLESRLHGRHGSDATTFSSSSSITLKLGTSPTSSLKGFKSEGNAASTRSRKCRRQAVQHAGDSDSECSDESGYVEYQERESSARAVVTQATTPIKPQPPPKPATRRIIGVAKVGTTTVV